MQYLVDEQSEPAYSTYFTRRLESFSDIVFGFSLSFSATQLQVPKPGQPEQITDLLLFFATFGLIAVVWFSHYRTFHDSFAGQPLDVVLNFVLLAGVAILPFTLQLSRQARVQGFVIEALDLALVFAIFSVLGFRGLKDHGRRLAPQIALRSFRRSILTAFVAAIALVTAAAVWRFGTDWSLLLICIAFARLIGRAIKIVPARFLQETDPLAGGVPAGEVTDAHS